MEYEDYYTHSKICKPETEKVEVVKEAKSLVRKRSSSK